MGIVFILYTIFAVQFVAASFMFLFTWVDVALLNPRKRLAAIFLLPYTLWIYFRVKNNLPEDFEMEWYDMQRTSWDRRRALGLPEIGL